MSNKMNLGAVGFLGMLLLLLAASAALAFGQTATTSHAGGARPSSLNNDSVPTAASSTPPALNTSSVTLQTDNLVAGRIESHLKVCKIVTFCHFSNC